MKSDSEENQYFVNNIVPEHEYSLKSMDLGTVLKNELKELTETVSCYKGYMDGGLEKCNSFLKRLQYLGYYFTIRSSISKHAGSRHNPRLTFSNVRSKMDIQTFGPPFFVTKSYHMDCLKGYKCRSLKIQNSTSPEKKTGCPAKLYIKIIKYFPKYAVSDNAKLKAKHKVMSRLKDDMSNPNCVIQFCERVYISISKENIHKHKPLLKDSGGKKVCNKEKTKYLVNKQQTSTDCENILLDENQFYNKDENDSNLKTEQNDNLEMEQIFLRKQNELKNIAQDIATLSNLIMDEQLLDKSINGVKEILDEMKKPFFDGSIVNIKEETL